MKKKILFVTSEAVPFIKTGGLGDVCGTLPKILKMIIPFYWNPGKTIIDVTAGKKISWKVFPYNHLSPCGYEHWHVDFNDIDKEKEAEYHYPAQEIDKIGKHYDILFNDFPFTELKNGLFSMAPSRSSSAAAAANAAGSLASQAMASRTARC